MKNTPTNDRQVEVPQSQSPTVIMIHSFSGRPMKDEARKKVVDGPMRMVHDALRKIPSGIIVEDESDL